METTTQEKIMMLLTQEEAGYVPVSTARGKACSACRWYKQHEHACQLVMGEVYPNGYCNRYEAPPMMEEPEPMPVTIVEPPMEMGEMSKKTVNEDGLFNRIWERIAKTLNINQPDSAFSVQKDLNGKWRWVAAFTNNFKDRDGEIISEKALDGYLERVNTGIVPMPELWLGHMKETKHGQADMVFGAGNFVVAVGSFDDTELGHAALKYYQKHAAKTPLSHGFTFPEWGLKQGIYGVINPFEITTLPPPLIPSNPFTEFEVENMKQISPEQKAALALVFGAEKADAIVTSRQQQSEEIKAAGVAYKDFAEVATDETKPVDTPAEGEQTQTPAIDPKVLLQLVADALEGQGEMLTAITDQGKALKAIIETRATEKSAQEKTIAELQTQVKELRAELRMSPRASEAAETKLSETEAAAMKEQMQKAEADPFWNS